LSVVHNKCVAVTETFINHPFLASADKAG